MAKFDYDCSGWATKAKTKCYDGLTIAPNAFQECDGKVVTMVYNHDHDNLENVLGHCLLENRPGGMYCYAKFMLSSSWPFAMSSYSAVSLLDRLCLRWAL